MKGIKGGNLVYALIFVNIREKEGWMEREKGRGRGKTEGTEWERKGAREGGSKSETDISVKRGM